MPTLTDQLTRCWASYRQGMLADVARGVRLAHELYREELPSLGATDAANATVELAMLDVTVGMVTAEGVDEVVQGSRLLAEMVTDPKASCDDLHRLAALATAVHAAMRAARFGIAEQHFRAALAMAQGLLAEDAGMADVCTVLGCAGLHLAQAAALGRDEKTTRALLHQSDQTAVELGIEHVVFGHYFGPQHVRATRSICLAMLGNFDEALEEGRAVDVDRLMPLMAATLLRALAEMSERVEQRGAAAVMRSRADQLVPPLRQQFG
jgi:hypothetical protein